MGFLSYYVNMTPKRIAVIIVSVFLFVFFLLFTNPKEVSLAVILAPFVLLGVIIYNILTLAIESFFKRSTKKKKVKLFALVGTVVLINFALLSSIGQLTPQDTVLAMLITLIGGFYLYKFQIT